MADDIASLGYDIDSSQARTAAGDLDKLNAASARVARGYGSLASASRNLLRDERGKFMSAQSAAEKYASEIDSLRAKYIPMYSASKQLAAGQDEIRRALELGAISSKQANTAMSALEAQYGVTGRAAQVMGTQVRGASAHTTNLMFQFQDIGMMLAAGQNPLMLAMQQGTQVSGVFQQMKNSGVSAFAGIKSGLLAMVSPMALMTIGTIAGVAALTQWAASAWGAGDSAKTLGETLDDLSEKVDAVKSQSEVFTLSGLERLREKYGDVDSQVLNLISNQKIYNDMLASQSLSTAIEGLLDSAGSRWYDIGINDFASSVLNLQSTLKITKNDAVTLKNAFDDLAAAEDYEAQLAALDQMGSYMAVLASKTGEGQEEAIRLLGGINDATDAVKQLAAGAPGAEWMEGAKKGVEELIVLLDDAGNILPDDGRGGARPKMRPMDLGVPEEKPERRGGGGGRGDARARELEAFIASLQTERETLEMWRIEQLELLAQYSNAELEAIGGQNEAKLRLEQEYIERSSELARQEHQNKMDGYQTMFGDLSGLMRTENAKLFKIGQAAAIANATIDGWEAATSAWKWGMSAGGPPLAVAASAASLAKTGAMIASIASQSPNGGGRGGSAAPSSASGTTATQAQPERVVRVAFDGPDWVQGIVEPLMTQIYEQTGDGTKVVFAK